VRAQSGTPRARWVAPSHPTSARKYKGSFTASLRANIAAQSHVAHWNNRTSARSDRQAVDWSRTSPTTIPTSGQRTAIETTHATRYAPLVHSDHA